jgi:hypothetical protein
VFERAAHLSGMPFGFSGVPPVAGSLNAFQDDAYLVAYQLPSRVSKK